MFHLSNIKHTSNKTSLSWIDIEYTNCQMCRVGLNGNSTVESVFQHRDSNPWPSNPDSVLFCNQSFLFGFGRFDFDGSTRLVADLLFRRNEQTHLNWMEPFLMTQIARLKNAIVIVWELIPSWSLTLKLIARNACHALRAAVVALWCSEHLVNKMSWVHILLIARLFSLHFLSLSQPLCLSSLTGHSRRCNSTDFP